jgi:hypothetical protein
VWVDDALHFVASRTSRKATNPAHDADCVIATRREALDLVVEGKVAKVNQEARLHRVAEVYMTKCGWPVTVRDGAFYADGTPTAGPPPYELYEVIPTTAFGFSRDATFNPTRWRF